MVLFGFVLAGCSSDLKDATDLPNEPVVRGPHGDNPIGNHGKFFTQSTLTISECRVCHSLDITKSSIAPSCFTSGCHYGNHASDLIVFASPGFHGKLLSDRNYDITGCQKCHAVDLSGGIAHKSCSGSGCHVATDGGPLACYTCHGHPVTKKIYPQENSFHRTHLEGGTLSNTTVACAECHIVPQQVTDTGHLTGSNPNGAEVFLNDPLAATMTNGKTGDPTFNYATLSCENVYCHGNFTNGNHFDPKWNGTEQAKCGTCHGDPATGNPLPKAPHVQVQTCYTCHSGVIDQSGAIIDKAAHINGKLNRFGSEVTDW